MKFYIVGGAVRDQLLGLPVKDHDWVVVGANYGQLLNQGYKPVGKDFPVFLHPVTHEEYALARTERKTAPGYHGFEVHATSDVTLEDDLQRRDLTINAMARDEQGCLIDPYAGQRDLEQRWLRHVSPAFAEDPVRILRLARFAARYAGLGFRVAPETLALVQFMVRSGEIDALVPERVWTETERALAEPDPAAFIQVLRQCGALARIFPDLERLFGVPQPARYHPEIDTGIHTLMCLQQAVLLRAESAVRFAVLMHDLGKGVTPMTNWPHHTGHEASGADVVKAFCQHYRVPNNFRDLAILVAQYHTHCHRALELRPSTLLKLLQNLDVLRRPQRLDQFLLACEADARGRKGLEQRPYPQSALLRHAQQAAAAVSPEPFLAQNLQGQAMAEAMRTARLAAIASAIRAASA